jgi:putative nucleotidyltransferase with HDIG domain
MERSETVFSAVSNLYEAATTSMGKWMWENHTQWVADKAKQLAEKYGANTEAVYCAALLHDLGDSTYERGNENFDAWSKDKATEILAATGFNAAETATILEAIRTHSCRSGNLPTSLEGKVLATADGMWHLQTSFFATMCYMHRPQHTNTYAEWQTWFTDKINRDFNVKLLFEEEKAEAKPAYDALLKIFTNKSME